MSWAETGGAAGAVVGGLLGYNKSKGDRRRARQMYEDAIREMQGLDVASRDQRMGDYQAGPSAYEGLESDPRLRGDQYSLLDDMIRRSREPGLGVQDRVALTEAKNEVNANEASQRQAILQQMAMRGQAGQGGELAARLVGQQGGANRMAMMGGQAAAAAANRSMQANYQGGQMAAGMRGQDWGEKSDRASAMDSVSRFNASQRQGAYNDAFDDSYRKAAGTNAARTGAADMYSNQADRRQQVWTGAGEGLGYSAGAGFDSYLEMMNPAGKMGGGKK